MQDKKPGTLYVVATPIGNLQDITLRAIEILKNVNRIAAEDTRHAVLLLKHFSIHKTTISLHDFNERERLQVILKYLQDGESIALISDAGTPLISDPGFYLVKNIKEAGITVVPIPGPSALIAALSAAGLPTDKFIFEGFLSPKTSAKRTHLTALAHATHTLVFYEGPHRLLATLEVMSEVFGEARKAVVARELTKIHESIINASLGELLEYYQTHPTELRGEVVILVAGAEEEVANQEVNPEAVLDILLEELPIKQAANLASKITGERKNILYTMALKKKNK